MQDTVRSKGPEQTSEERASYHENASAFVLAALNEAIKAAESGRHVGAHELVEVVRDLAIERYGLMARTVLEYWGIRTTDDVGHLVFEMMEQGVLVKADSDRLEHFSDLFDFEQAFDVDYPWAVAV